MVAEGRRARALRLKVAKSRPDKPVNWFPELEEPHSGQQEVLDTYSTFNVLCMGRRWGKSILVKRLLIAPMLQGRKVGFGVPEFAKASGIWREIKRKLKGLIAHKDDNLWELTLKTGGFLKVFALDRNPDGPRSFDFFRFVIDEAAFCRHLKQVLEDAVLPTLLDAEDSELWLLSSSRGKNEFWEYWKRGDADSGETRLGWKSWRKPTSTNPHLSAARLKLLREEVSPRKAAVEYDASFDTGGLFFDDWQESFPPSPDDPAGRDWHVCTPFAVPSWWPSSGGMDFGKRVFAAGVLRWDEEGNCFITREVTVLNGVPTEQAEAVCKALEAEGIDKRDCVFYADPAGFPPEDPAKRRGQYPVEAFWAAGLRVVKAENNRAATNANVAEWLRAGLRPGDGRAKAGRLDEIGEGQSYPRLRVFRGRCPELVRTIPLMEPLKDNPDDFDSDAPDHHVDGILRYGLRRFNSPPRARRTQEGRNIPMPVRAGTTSRGIF